MNTETFVFNDSCKIQSYLSTDSILIDNKIGCTSLSDYIASVNKKLDIIEKINRSYAWRHSKATMRR